MNIAYDELVKMILLLVLVMSVFAFGMNFCSNDEVSGFSTFTAAMKEVSVQREGTIRKVTLSLEEDSALVIFAPESDVSSMSRPDECDEQKTCVCLCKEFKSDLRCGSTICDNIDATIPQLSHVIGTTVEVKGGIVVQNAQKGFAEIQEPVDRYELTIQKGPGMLMDVCSENICLSNAEIEDYNKPSAQEFIEQMRKLKGVELIAKYEIYIKYYEGKPENIARLVHAYIDAGGKECAVKLMGQMDLRTLNAEKAADTAYEYYFSSHKEIKTVEQVLKLAYEKDVKYADKYADILYESLEEKGDVQALVNVIGIGYQSAAIGNLLVVFSGESIHRSDALKVISKEQNFVKDGMVREYFLELLVESKDDFTPEEKKIIIGTVDKIKDVEKLNDFKSEFMS